MIEAVIFDMDGVLADTEYYYENRRKNFLLENGIPIPEGNFIGSNEKAIWEAIVPNDPVRRQEMLMAYREYRKARPTPYGKLTDPQAEPLMNALRSRGLKVAVASSSAAPDIMKMLTEGGLKAMVDFAFSGEDCAAHKPAPDIYLKALKALGLTADKGMAGSFNQNVLKLLLEKADRNDRFYVIGQVGYRALRKDPRLVQEFQYGATAPSLQRARDITVDAIDDFKSGKLDEIYLIYTKIQNALTSEPVMVRLLPLDREHLQPTPKGLGDPRGEVELVPDAWTVFEQTAPIYMHGMIFGAMTESFCAEQSARMTAMDSATKSAKDMIHDLELEYNRSRQGSITQEITEIIGGASAVKSQE